MKRIYIKPSIIEITVTNKDLLADSTPAISNDPSNPDEEILSKQDWSFDEE